MRVTSILMAGAFALFANAQSTSVAPPTTTDTATAGQTSQQAEITRCINACTPGDVSCTSKCIAVPNPNEQQVNATNNCVANCPKGQGTEADNTKYAQCLDGCIGQYFFTASAGTPQPTGASGSGNNNGGSPSGTKSGSSSPTGTTNNQGGSATSGAPAGNTSNPAALLQVSGAAAGIVGFVAALMAL
ncbi:hypothetical protein QBC43DRAFT_308948 [Cladorrhinum sp. PSN259]|nr:hypothetical protein QBC43DRAFT_308948 [Cladorrhinum sp. PSN259]